MQSINERNRIRAFSNFDDEQLKDNATIFLKVANSKWSNQNTDALKLHKFPINIEGRGKNHKQRCEYTLASNLRYLPYPFSKTMLVTFLPKFKIYNKWNAWVFVLQGNWEESLCLYPSEVSEFHWTDTHEKKEIKIKYDGFGTSGKLLNLLKLTYLYLGPILVDKNCCEYIRLKSTTENSMIILSLVISEIGSSFLIELNDTSFIPPYRIWNMTKNDLAISQALNKIEDYDTIHSYQKIEYALTYPMSDKKLKIWIKSHNEKIPLTTVQLDSMKNVEIISVISRSKIPYIIKISREKSEKGKD